MSHVCHCDFNKLNYNLKLREKNYFFTCLYRFPSQKEDQCELVCNNLDLCLFNINEPNSVCSVLTGNFNARSSTWWNFAQDSREGNKIDSITPTIIS